MEQSFYKSKTEKPAPAATPALDMQAVIKLISNPELLKKALESVQFANNT